MARILDLQGHYEEASAEYAKDEEFWPNRAATHYLRSRTLERSRHPEEAIAELKVSLQLEPKKWPTGWADLGDGLMKKKDWVGALSAYETAAKLDPNHRVMVPFRVHRLTAVR